MQVASKTLFQIIDKAIEQSHSMSNDMGLQRYMESTINFVLSIFDAISICSSNKNTEKNG